jgi:hypothetical protein
MLLPIPRLYGTLRPMAIPPALGAVAAWLAAASPVPLQSVLTAGAPARVNRVKSRLVMNMVAMLPS